MRRRRIVLPKRKLHLDELPKRILGIEVLSRFQGFSVAGQAHLRDPRSDRCTMSAEDPVRHFRNARTAPITRLPTDIPIPSQQHAGSDLQEDDFEFSLGGLLPPSFVLHPFFCTSTILPICHSCQKSHILEVFIETFIFS